jgi:hypothetical protein
MGGAPRPVSPLQVFSRPGTTADRIPATAAGARVLAQPPLLPGEQHSRSRRIDLGGGASAYVWPAIGGVCYDLSPVGSGCMPIARIARRGLDVAVLAQVSPSSRRYQRARILGIARDGIRSVVLLLPGGRRVTTEVHDNGFFKGGLRAPPTAVQWRDGRGSHVVPVRALSPGEIGDLH